MIFYFLPLGVLICATWFVYKQYNLKRRLPPGPPGLPLIGNLHQAPSIYPWRTYSEWHKKYGPIFSLQYGPRTIIMLGTHQVAHELLDKKSNIYSSRPRLVMTGECISKGLRTLLLPYGFRWRAHHRLQASVLNVQMVQKYQAVQDLESKHLLVDLLARNDFAECFHRYSASVIFSLAYGRRTPTGHEPEVKTVDHIMQRLNKAFLETWVVDIFPFLNILPTFIAPWKRRAEKMHNFERSFFTGLLESSEHKSSWNWSKQMRNVKESQTLSKTELAYVLGVTYEAGSDTTSMALEVFVLAAVLHPDAVHKAQEELDRVVGPSRLPHFGDLDRLSYIQAFVKEVHRWRPIIPGGVPHATSDEDEYLGYHIPKGATVFANHWAISMDSNTYHNPDAFNPDRWIDDPSLPFSPFGFGRRICVGKFAVYFLLVFHLLRGLVYSNQPFRTTSW